MSTNFENKPNTNEVIPVAIESEAVVETMDANQLENFSDKATKEVGNLVTSEVSHGEDVLSRFPEETDSPEGRSLEYIDQQIKDLGLDAVGTIAWIKERFNLSKMESENYDNVEIQGEPEFRQKMKDSMQFLSLAPDKLEFAEQHIQRIQQWEHSGMNMFKDVPTFEVGDIWKTHDAVYLASGIAHEAYHAFLCNSSRDGEGNIALKYFMGKEAENRCMAFQIETLKEIQNTDHMKEYQEMVQEHIDDITDQSINPTHQEIPYEERNW